MSNREYMSGLTSEEVARYMHRLIMERAVISYSGTIQRIAEWLDKEHTSEFDKENYIEWH